MRAFFVYGSGYHRAITRRERTPLPSLWGIAAFQRLLCPNLDVPG